ncbi:helix-turn-helix domain-containing protein [Hyphobacterium sp.]|uniref:helix-turn-helix domain-containing protein n=1 Tax=Hyphobacterium sp. TaxID=2004662 RepID=UPI003BAC9B84
MPKPKKPSIFAIRDAIFLKGPAKAVAFTLAMRENKKLGYAWPSIQKIADDCGYSTRSVQRALNKLEQRGLVIIYRRRGRSNCYKIDWKVFYRRDEQARAAMAILTAQDAGDLNLDWTDCRHGTSSRSATLDSLTPKESRIPIKDLAGFDELNALEEHQRKYGVDSEMAFMGVLERRGHHSLVQALAPEGVPNFRIEYDPSEQSAGDKHDFHLIWHHASVGKFKDLGRILAPLGFKSANVYSAASYENMKAGISVQSFAPVPTSVLIEELASR